MPSSKLNSIFDSILAKRVASTVQRCSHGFGNELENVQFLILPYTIQAEPKDVSF